MFIWTNGQTKTYLHPYILIIAFIAYNRTINNFNNEITANNPHFCPNINQLCPNFNLLCPNLVHN